MELHTRQSPGETFPHLWFPVNHKSQLPPSYACVYELTERDSEKHCVSKVEITLRSAILLLFKALHLCHQQASHVVSTAIS